MPDNADYEWLGWLVAHPKQWSDDDLTAARSMVENQKRAIADSHPKDAKSRRSYQEVVAQLESAIHRHERTIET